MFQSSELRMGYNNYRRYRFSLKLLDQNNRSFSRVVQPYLPSATTFTKATTINLGNVARYFK
ncbi:MAG: hypothetical protein IID05_00800 [Gemmatimonadetes bacterium]|nr:hypothetical protein [Gemmatimonadota bacterium]